ncbi:hypothetical protein MTR67_035072 [Solanum verrucosum]|uniref:Uncharacterized protein n=1 Tax=Solanum verrucosum TaxID=315347 RepID=A0AAF0ZJV9_SOLVR|nr:hypothetical protein MTR67_035072 [Solanum verrucosum]
MIVRRNTQN